MVKNIVLGYDRDGRQIRKRIYGNTDTQLRNAELAARMEFEEASNPSLITFRAYREKWFQTYKSSRELATQEAYDRVFKKCAPLDHMKMKQITKTDLQRVISENSQYPELCRKIRSAFRQIFQAAYDDGIIKRNVAAGLSIPKKKEKTYFRLDEEQTAALSRMNLPPREEMLVNVYRWFGLRPEEARALMPGDFDFQNRNVTISRAIIFDVETPVLKGTKTDNVRVIPIPDSAVPKLKKYIEDLDGLYLFPYKSRTIYRTAWDHIKRALCTACYGWADTIRCPKKDIAKNNKINEMNMERLKGFTPYVFRREFATRLYYSGITLKKAAYLMGHSSTAMIMNIYAQISDNEEPVDALRKFVL